MYGGDDDITSLVEMRHMEEVIANAPLWNKFHRIVERMMAGETIDNDDAEWFDVTTSQIKTKDHCLYAYWYVNDRFELRKIIYASLTLFRGSSPNLNWVDVSDITNMVSLFSTQHYRIPTSGNIACEIQYCTCYDSYDVNSRESDKIEDYGRFIRKLGCPWEIVDYFNGDISLWDVSNVRTMEGMFTGCRFNGDISGWDVSNVENMEGMFGGSSFNQDISKWDVSNVETMILMFANNSHFKGDISGWDVSNVHDMSSMFASSTFDGNINDWDISSVEDMFHMFSNASFNSDISGWDVSSVSSMYAMFEKADFDQDISGWKVRKSCIAKHMFLESMIRDEHIPFSLRDRDEIKMDYEKNDWK